MATKSKPNVLVEALNERRKKESKTRRHDAYVRSQREAIITKHVFPCMPRGLTRYFTLAAHYTSWSISLVFKLKNDVKGDDKKMAFALGIIPKTVQRLRREGWSIYDEPNARPSGKELEIAFNGGRQFKETRHSLSVIFGGFTDTPKCHLVEKEVIVATVAEHKEKRMVVECDKEEKED